MTVPVPCVSGAFNYWFGGLGLCSDNSSNQGDPCRIYIQAGTSNLALDKAFNAAAWTASGTKDAEFQFSYPI